jgi:tRNA threonylcarbamoyladenosine biosynthesis protein TsaE
MSTGDRAVSGGMPERAVLTEAELVSRGEQLGQALAPGAVVHLSGDLGAGKTTLARAIIRGLGAADMVSSPTYALVHHYHGARGHIYHVDAYRLRHPDEAADLDWQTLTSADALLVEWPERAAGWVPPASLRIALAHTDDDTRRIMELS